MILVFKKIFFRILNVYIFFYFIGYLSIGAMKILILVFTHKRKHFQTKNTFLENYLFSVCIQVKSKRYQHNTALSAAM